MTDLIVASGILSDLEILMPVVTCALRHCIGVKGPCGRGFNRVCSATGSVRGTVL